MSASLDFPRRPRISPRLNASTDLAAIVEQKPRKTLGFQTPQEIFNTEILTEPVALQI
jgi:IS30 family transposase